MNQSKTGMAEDIKLNERNDAVSLPPSLWRRRHLLSFNSLIGKFWNAHFGETVGNNRMFIGSESDVAAINMVYGGAGTGNG
jgi:hypothetical protein